MSKQSRLRELLSGNGLGSVDAKQGNSYLGAELTSNGEIKKLKARARYKHDQGSDERYGAIKEGVNYFGSGPHWDVQVRMEGEEKFSFHAPRRLGFWRPSASTEITLPKDNRNYLPLLHYAMKEAGLHVKLEEDELDFSRRQYFDKVQPEEVANCYRQLNDLGFEATVSSTGIELGRMSFV